MHPQNIDLESMDEEEFQDYLQHYSSYMSDREAFLAHYGVKGMKWGVRKERDESRAGGLGSMVAARTFQATVIGGAGTAGRLLGGAAGTAVLGPPLGSMVGQYAGAAVATRLAAKPFSDRHKAKTDAALADLSGAVPSRHSKYTDGMLKQDISDFGPDGAKRINDSMRKGVSHRQATRDETGLQLKAWALSAGTTYAVGKLSGPAGKAVLKKTGKSAQARRQRNAYDPNNLKFAKTNRSGVPNISSMR